MPALLAPESLMTTIIKWSTMPVMSCKVVFSGTAAAMERATASSVVAHCQPVVETAGAYEDGGTRSCIYRTGRRNMLMHHR